MTVFYVNVFNLIFKTVVGCHDIKQIPNGHVQKSGSRYLFSCKSGYTLKGASSLGCHAGKFSANVPTCEG